MTEDSPPQLLMGGCKSVDPGKDAGSLMQSVFLAKVSDASAGPRRHVGDLLGRKRLILVVKKNHCLALAGLKKSKIGFAHRGASGPGSLSLHAASRTMFVICSCGKSSRRRYLISTLHSCWWAKSNFSAFHITNEDLCLKSPCSGDGEMAIRGFFF